MSVLRNILEDGLGESAVFAPDVITPFKRIGEMTVDGRLYEVAIDTLNANPIIISTLTGKRFHLSWEAIAVAAIKAGIDDAKQLVVVGM